VGRNKLQGDFQTFKRKQLAESERLKAKWTKLQTSVTIEVTQYRQLVQANSTATLGRKVDQLITEVASLQEFCNGAKDSLATLGRQVSDLSAQTETDKVETEKFKLRCTNLITQVEEQLKTVVRKHARLETASSSIERNCEQMTERAIKKLSESMESLLLKHRDETRKSVSDYRAETQVELTTLRLKLTEQKSQGADPVPEFRSTLQSPAKQKP
jgi:hypothetical protein